MLDAFVFLLLLQAVGLIGVPFAAALFARLFGGGLAFGRPLGQAFSPIGLGRRRRSSRKRAVTEPGVEGVFCEVVTSE